jgi:2-polyprenyl-3-methyl-5-hydroxy-6-metoxy-1,4-benzoquinol methylase
LKKNFLNTIFWNARYERFPVLGSGIGSRGEALERKKQLISKCIYGSVNLTIVDVGCGDLEAMKDFNFKNYLGIDISEKAIEIAKTKRSEWKFVVGDIRLLSSYEADVVLCLDVLIHQKTRKDFEDILQALINMCKKRLIVGSYNCLPNYTSDITFFHRPILEALEESHLFSEISVVGKYRDCSLVVADKHTNSIKDPHLRDLKAKDFNQASKLCTRPDLLRYMVDLARDKLGFFTEQFTRTFEYTWLVSQIEKDVQGKLILDIGAGVCPLPLYLSALGAKVVTIDKHPLIRKLNEQQTWNEWGFLDYSLLDPKIVSFNLSATSYKTESKFDIIYSISVIEHLPSEERKRLLHNVRKLIKDGGEFFMSIDLHPETCQVWNYSEGKLVEDYAKHGNLNSFLEHIEESGFSVLYHDVLRNIPNSRTDLAFIAAKAGFQAIKRKSIVCQLLAKINNFINLNVGRKT